MRRNYFEEIKERNLVKCDALVAWRPRNADPAVSKSFIS
jgi:hypothetical protein